MLTLLISLLAALASISNALFPQISIPDVDLPDISVPDINLPDITIPDVNLPDISIPDINLPDITVPDINLPDISIPDISLPDFDLPHIPIPDVNLPDISLPDISLPDISIPDLIQPLIPDFDVAIPGLSLSCDLNTKLSDTCGSITISGVSGGIVDGLYIKIGDSLFQKSDGSNTFITYWNGFYLASEIGDKRCQLSTDIYRLMFPAFLLDNIIVGEAASLIPDFPFGGRVQVACNSPPPTPPSIPSLCFSTSYTGTFTSASGITQRLHALAGEYIPIEGGLNDLPAWELDNGSCDDGASSTLMYDPGFQQYLFVRNSNRVENTYYFECSNTNAIASGNPQGLCDGALQDYMSLNTLTSGSCACGLS